MININAGILLLLGGIWNSKTLEGSGFGIGMAAWIMIIISSILGILWYINEITFGDMYNMVLLILFVQGDLGFFFTFPTFLYTWGLINTVIHLCFGAACTVLGSIAFGLVIGRTKSI